MADEQRPTGIGWPADVPSPADQPRPTGEPSPAEDDRPFWSLSREDQRLLWVTFVGGVASFIVGAVIIGAAIGLARVSRAAGFELLAVSTGIFGFGSLVCVFFFWVWLHQVPLQERRRLRRVKRWHYWYLLVTGVLFFVVESALILIWIGLGAGIK
jgi:hypothetical protein